MPFRSKPDTQERNKFNYQTFLNTFLDDNIREIEQVDLQGVKHTLSGYDNLFWLFFNGQWSNQGRNFLSRFPFGQLTQTFLTGPYGGVNNFQEELPSSGVENENGSVDRLGCQVSFESFVNGYTVYISIIDEPDDLIWKEFTIVLWWKIWLSGLRRVELNKDITLNFERLNFLIKDGKKPEAEQKFNSRFSFKWLIILAWRPFRIRSLKTYMAGLAFMIFAIACWTSGLQPGNQWP